MTSVLIVYFILTSAHRWEFLAIEPSDSQAYCSLLASQAKVMFTDSPGNMRVVCMDDIRMGT